jgi:hypothetical protein
MYADVKDNEKIVSVLINHSANISLLVGEESVVKTDLTPVYLIDYRYKFTRVKPYLRPS